MFLTFEFMSSLSAAGKLILKAAKIQVDPGVSIYYDYYSSWKRHVLSYFR